MFREILTISQTSRTLYCGSRLSARAAFRFFSSTPLGRPPSRPRARAAASPAFVRSRIRSRSNSASEAKYGRSACHLKSWYQAARARFESRHCDLLTPGRFPQGTVNLISDQGLWLVGNKHYGTIRNSLEELGRVRQPFARPFWCSRLRSIPGAPNDIVLHQGDDDGDKRVRESDLGQPEIVGRGLLI